MLHLDASIGEGGGQVLRTALALSVVTQTPVHLFNIRAKRPNPGLAPQHLTCVQALSVIANAQVEGAQLGSTSLTFTPSQPQAGVYHFAISTAGSLTLLLHALYFPLSLLPQESHLTLTGGTHVKWSPTWDYAEIVWAQMLKKMGISLQLSLKRAGFYPKGGGEVSVSISPAKQIFPLSLSKREGTLNAEGLISIHQIPSHVPARIQARTKQILQSIGLNPEFYVRECDAPSPGCAFLLTVKWEGGIAGFDSIGERRKPAEKVAEESAYTCLKFVSTNATLDQHLADQLLLPAAFAKGTSEFRTPRITQHLLTNAGIIQHFLPVKIEIEGESEKPGLVRVHPVPKSDVH